MTLPAHLSKYDGLIDALVDALVREIQTGELAIEPSTPETRKPALPTKRTRVSRKDTDGADTTLPT